MTVRNIIFPQASTHQHGRRQETTAAARFGIRSFVYMRRRPFHPHRYHTMQSLMQQSYLYQAPICASILLRMLKNALQRCSPTKQAPSYAG